MPTWPAHWPQMMPMQHNRSVKAQPAIGDLSAGPPVMRFQYETGKDCLGTVIENVSTAISETGLFSKQLCENAHVVVAEVINNIAEHSYQGKSGGPIQLSIDMSDNKIAVEALDFGMPMPQLAVPCGQRPNHAVPMASLPEGGFGWYLIHTLAPKPRYIRRGHTNILRFVVQDCDDHL